jgi:hypothetical protein
MPVVPTQVEHKSKLSDEYKQTLLDAEILLQYAAGAGLKLDKATEEAVTGARTAFDAGSLDEATTSALLTALATLANLAAPVTPESLRAALTATASRPPYRNWAIALAVVIVVYSTVSLVTSNLANSIRADITTANGLAVKLGSEYAAPSADSSITSAQGDAAAPPSDSRRIQYVLQDFQEYATCIRSIDTHARQLSLFVHLYKYVLHPETIDPFYEERNNLESLREELEVPVPLVNYAGATVQLTTSYQKVRYFGKDVADDVSFYYGAVSSCILPVLYALLGAFAYLLRSFQQHVATRTYVPSGADSARFIVAAIGGAVVGLFSNLEAGQTIKVSPFALAFLVGYAVDVFYAFLESLIQSFTKTALSSTSQTQVSKADTGKGVVPAAVNAGTSGDAAEAAGAGG